MTQKADSTQHSRQYGRAEWLHHRNEVGVLWRGKGHNKQRGFKHRSAGGQALHTHTQTIKKARIAPASPGLFYAGSGGREPER